MDDINNWRTYYNQNNTGLTISSIIIIGWIKNKIFYINEISGSTKVVKCLMSDGSIRYFSTNVLPTPYIWTYEYNNHIYVNETDINIYPNTVDALNKISLADGKNLRGDIYYEIEGFAYPYRVTLGYSLIIEDIENTMIGEGLYSFGWKLSSGYIFYNGIDYERNESTGLSNWRAGLRLNTTSGIVNGYINGYNTRSTDLSDFTAIIENNTLLPCIGARSSTVGENQLFKLYDGSPGRECIYTPIGATTIYDAQ